MNVRTAISRASAGEPAPARPAPRRRGACGRRRVGLGLAPRRSRSRRRPAASDPPRRSRPRAASSSTPAARSCVRKRGSGSRAAPLRQVVLAPVLRLLVVRRVGRQAGHLGLDERRSVAGQRARDRLARRPGSSRARRSPSTTTPGHAVAGGAHRDVARPATPARPGTLIA